MTAADAELVHDMEDPRHGETVLACAHMSEIMEGGSNSYAIETHFLHPPGGSITVASEDGTILTVRVIVLCPDCVRAVDTGATLDGLLACVWDEEGMVEVS